VRGGPGRIQIDAFSRDAAGHRGHAQAAARIVPRHDVGNRPADKESALPIFEIFQIAAMFQATRPALVDTLRALGDYFQIAPLATRHTFELQYFGGFIDNGTTRQSAFAASSSRP